MKTALVIGSGGQDGTLISRQLLAAGFQVFGLTRGGWSRSTPPLPPGLPATVENREALERCMQVILPDEVYYLAAFHHSSEETVVEDTPALLAKSIAVHVNGFVNVLEALARTKADARTFYAASSHVFGEPGASPQDEFTPFAPVSLYGITKSAGVEVARYYRRRGLHVSTGILYNHESPLRAEKFVTQRIVRGAIRAARAKSRGDVPLLELGNLSARVDWGWADDYVAAMRRIVSHPSADDYVVATGTTHTIEQFCDIAFTQVGLSYRDWVRERPGRLTRRPPPTLVGDATRLRRATGWEPTLSFEQMVGELVRAAQLAAD